MMMMEKSYSDVTTAESRPMRASYIYFCYMGNFSRNETHVLTMIPNRFRRMGDGRPGGRTVRHVTLRKRNGKRAANTITARTIAVQ